MGGAFLCALINGACMGGGGVVKSKFACRMLSVIETF
jgi:hypothetical protein